MSCPKEGNCLSCRFAYAELIFSGRSIGVRPYCGITRQDLDIVSFSSDPVKLALFYKLALEECVSSPFQTVHINLRTDL